MGWRRKNMLGIGVAVLMALLPATGTALSPGGGALHRACAGGTADEVLAALRAGGDVQARDDSGRTPLMIAALSSVDPTVVSTLLEWGADAALALPDGRTALMMAAARNFNADIAAALIDGGSDPNGRDTSGATPLMYAAAYNGDSRVLEVLLDGGADPGAHDASGNSALLYAARNPVGDGARLLLALGEGRGKNKAGETPLMLAARGNPNPEVVALFMEEDKDGWAAAFALALQHNPSLDVAALFLEKGLPVNGSLPQAGGPLMVAARFNPNPDVISLLV
ncbi:MAG TPA: hypothetical protein DIC53_07870, partial [Synergistaceae bacterium]|nr:hypothetical protein [Synergistaceae bacterium]